MKLEILKIKVIIVLILVILFSPGAPISMNCSFAYADQKMITNKSSDLKNKIKTNFGKINNFIADLVIRDHSGENIEGKIFYKSAPNRMKFVLQYSTGEKIIKYVTADSEIIYIPDKNIAIKSLPSKDVLSNSPTVVMDYVNTDQAEVTEDNQFYYYKIYLPVPENLLINDEIPVVMKTHINKRHYYTERIIFLNKKGEEIQVQELKNYKLNISIDDREFNFSPPQGCKFVFRQEQ